MATRDRHEGEREVLQPKRRLQETDMATHTWTTLTRINPDGTKDDCDFHTGMSDRPLETVFSRALRAGWQAPFPDFGASVCVPGAEPIQSILQP